MPVSRDPSQCDLFLFPKLKKLCGIQFGDDNAILNPLEEAIESLTKDDLKNCFDDWFCRMHKCIEAKGGYFEKIHKNQALIICPKSRRKNFWSAPCTYL